MRSTPAYNSLTMPFSRRTLLGGVLGLGALGTLTACNTGPLVEYRTDSGPVQGGILRVGLTGGDAADTLDAHIPTNSADTARCVNLYEPLLRRNDDYELEYRLAESFEPNTDATVWTVVLREGLKFSDGSAITSDAVKATIARITDPDDPKNGAAMLTHVSDVVVVNDRTVNIELSAADAELDDAFSQYQMGIVPVDYDPSDPVSSGAFKLKDFVPAQSTVLERNEHHFEGPAHLDEVHLLNFSENDAMINALLSTQVDALAQLPPALAKVLRADERLRVLDSETGMWLPFTMRVDVAPFDDVRVRQAFRLAIDRQQMVDQVFSGHGFVGNDMYAVFDPAYPQDLPQREQDIAQAKQLLAEAGYPDGISVELVAAPIQSGAVEAAQVFAQQAAAAGINISIRRLDETAFWENYLEWDFALSFWYTRNFLAQTSQSTVEGAPFNETHWLDADYAAAVAAARAERDDEQRYAMIRQQQQRLYEEGGYIIWGFFNQVDAYHSYVVGLQENATGSPLGGYNFHRVWIAEVAE
ncbi:ABC transporter substrate-binding protein [Enteractinococcus helveticum]|nr:ABC transporter substrate-binding protein [Enteractinococcus helveticum]